MKFLPEGITSKVGMSLLKLRKNSPAITFGIGVIGVVGTAVLASRATLKLDGIIDDAQKTLTDIETIIHVDYSDDDRKRDKALVYVKTALKIGKLYLPAIAAGTITIAALTTSHVTLTKRNVALTAAYASVTEAFKKYRNRVIDDLGDDQDKKYLYGLEDGKKTVVSEDGKKSTVKTKNATDVISPYARLYGVDNPNWENEGSYNIIFLQGIQRTCNDRLRAKGHLFLNEVYDELGFERTPEGQIVGWLYEGDGDGYVTFGIFEPGKELTVLEHVTNREHEIWLDFNVDGNIYDKI